MYGTSKTSQTLPAELQERLMLSPEQVEGHAINHHVIVIAREHGNDVHLKVYAAGLNEYELRGRLRQGLRRALVGRHNDWVCDVRIENGEVVVMVNSYGHLRGKTLALVLGCIPAQLQPLSEVRYRTVHVFSGNEKLVLVDVQEQDSLFGIDFEIPGQLTMAGAGEDDDAKALERELYEVLRQLSDRSLSVSYHRGRSGTRLLSVKFHPVGGRPSPATFYDVADAVLREIKKRSSADGVYSRLVFAEAQEFAPWVDDGSEAASRYIEY